MIGSCNCLITANCPIARSGYIFADQNTAVYAPIIFEEIVIVMIKGVILLVISNRSGASRLSHFEMHADVCSLKFTPLGQKSQFACWSL